MSRHLFARGPWFVWPAPLRVTFFAAGFAMLAFARPAAAQTAANADWPRHRDARPGDCEARAGSGVGHDCRRIARGDADRRATPVGGRDDRRADRAWQGLAAG